MRKYVDSQASKEEKTYQGTIFIYLTNKYLHSFFIAVKIRVNLSEEGSNFEIPLVRNINQKT